MTHLIEEDSGTVVLRTPHPHNGYYAGDFSAVPFEQPDLRHLPSYVASHLPTHLPTAQNRRVA